MNNARVQAILLVLAIAIGVARIVDTYHVFNATLDEPVHLESGIEWLEFSRLTVNQMHPPLSRAFIAAGPYLHGVRWQNKPDFRDEGIAELHSRGDYWHTLALARMGILPFFVLAVVATWWLARAIFGPGVALASAASLTLLPPFLAHAGIATTDLAVAAMMPVVIVAGVRWLDEPQTLHASLLGGVSGVAVLLKFSALFLVPACLIAMLFVSAAITAAHPPRPPQGTRLFRSDPRHRCWSGSWWSGRDTTSTSARPTRSSSAGSSSGDFVSPRLARLRIVPAPRVLERVHHGGLVQPYQHSDVRAWRCQAGRGMVFLPRRDRGQDADGLPHRWRPSARRVGDHGAEAPASGTSPSRSAPPPRCWRSA